MCFSQPKVSQPKKMMPLPTPAPPPPPPQPAAPPPEPVQQVKQKAPLSTGNNRQSLGTKKSVSTSSLRVPLNSGATSSNSLNI